jgi:cytoplasmic iron level regulating protein YaaA (DUF328/UPF0246 family)
MLIVLSPAKSLDLETLVTTDARSQPEFSGPAAQLIARLREFSPQQLGSLMGISDALSALNVGRYASWSEDVNAGHAENADIAKLGMARQAVMAFNGDVYEALDARSLAPGALDYLQARVRILSGLYGVLRPLDMMQPHRLEMGTRLLNARGKDLYAYWGDSITDALNRTAQEQGARVLVNLASEEYFKSVKPARLALPVVAPVFQDWKNGKYKIISFYAKRARGLMARYAAQNAFTDVEQLKSFDVDGYAFCAADSDQRNWIFRRRA